MSGCCMDGTCGAHENTFVELMEKLGAKDIIVGKNSVVATNGQFGGWVKTKDNSYVSVEYAKTLNRAQRRKQGIKLT